ncbi:MAG: helix-turn-helix transcriptional regulator [Chitinophagaceae bacterium]|nr:helix-turn-helix transcriptional regulator [Chitinophagaceae bacterium]
MEVLRHMGRQLDVKMNGSKISMPADVAEGTVSLVEFPNNLQVMISDYIVKQDVLLHRKKNNKEHFSLRFDELTDPSGVRKNSIFLYNTKYESFHLHNNDTTVKSVTVGLEKKWLEQFLSADAAGDEIFKYILLKVTAFHFDIMDNEIRQVFKELLETDTSFPGVKIIQYNRVMLLIESFFSKIYKKISDTHFEARLTKDEIARLKVVESGLMQDFSMPPPPINKLSQMAAMSPSKFKNVFKDMYGLPVYQYYQKHRMQKAKAMLLSGKYSVKEVGYELGYANINNFSKAFRKAFDQLPVQLIRQ